MRNYGFDTDDTMYHQAWGALTVPLERWPARNHVRQAYAGHPELQSLTDPYFRGFDTTTRISIAKRSGSVSSPTTSGVVICRR